MADPPLDYEDVTKAEFLLNPTVETDYCVEKPNILVLEKVCRESKTQEAEAKDETQGDPFKHSICNKYYWKVTAIVYLALCVLLATIYVAIYAEQHGYYGSYYDNLENLGKPLHPLGDKGQWSKFIDSPYTEWLSRRLPFEGHSISTWPPLPKSLSSVHQVVGHSLGNTTGVWAITPDSVFYVDVLCEDAVCSYDIGKAVGLSISPNTHIATGKDASVFLIDSNSVTQLNCSSINRCKILNDQTNLELGAVSTALVANGNRLWIGSDRGLFAAWIGSSGVEVPKRVPEVSGPVYSIAWRSALPVSSHPSCHQKNSLQFSEDQCLSLLRQASGGLRKDDSCFIEKVSFINNSSAQTILANSSVSSSNGYFPVNSTLSHLLLQYCGSFVGSTGMLDNVQVLDHPGLLAAGVGFKVYFFDGKQWWFEWTSRWEEGLGGVVDGPVTSLTFVPSGELFLGNNVSLSRLNNDYSIDRLGPSQGLPYNKITSLSFLPYSTLYPNPFGVNLSKKTRGSVVVTTEKGMTIFDITSSTFVSYFHGLRWLPGNAVALSTSVNENTFVVVTDGGWALIRGEDWTLQQKSAHYLSMLPRHTRAPGLVSDCPLENYNQETCEPQTTDNDGLWTAWLVASEAFRHQVEGNTTAAWSLYQGMHFLNMVTGIEGLMGRSVVLSNASVSGGVWHNSTTDPQWKWKGDTSSDEVVGHMFAYPIVYDLVAMTTEDKDNVKSLIDSIIGYIKGNGYYLVDVTGRPTRWGVWAPDQLNLNQSWADEHGLNSLQILTFLLSAYRITGKSEYLEAWQTLFNGSTEGIANHYGMNMINQKITFPRDDNFSDDELAFLPYFTYFYTLKMLKVSHPSLAENLLGTAKISLERTWKSVSLAKSSAWSAIYCYCSDLCDSKVVENLIWNLRTWPLELIEWPVENSHRLDISFNREQDRDFNSHSQSKRVLPANERGQLRWNGNPFQLDHSGSSSEMDPGPWLLPYWLSRWSDIL